MNLDICIHLCGTSLSTKWRYNYASFRFVVNMLLSTFRVPGMKLALNKCQLLSYIIVIGYNKICVQIVKNNHS